MCERCQDISLMFVDGIRLSSLVYRAIDNLARWRRSELFARLPRTHRLHRHRHRNSRSESSDRSTYRTHTTPDEGGAKPEPYLE
jgi:hypothetical protein